MKRTCTPERKKVFYEKVGKSGVFFVLGCHVRARSFLRVFYTKVLLNVFVKQMV